ncbi:MAG: hypothetical protein LBP94_07425, partial [Zoogloeaceae bacterium]|nr:hypothetical protein [Zoogloeaceae bacterium]
EPVEHTPAAENYSFMPVPAESVSTPDVAAPLHSETQVLGVQQNTLPEIELAVPPVSKHGGRAVSKPKSVLQTAAIAVQAQQPIIEADPVHKPRQKTAPAQVDEHVSSVIPVMRGEETQNKVQRPSPKATGVAPEREATMAAASIQQAKQAREALSPSVHAPPQPLPVREESAPQVQIGTIEVIVESTPVMQRSSSPNTGFTRDPGRYYQRRL